MATVTFSLHDSYVRLTRRANRAPAGRRITGSAGRTMLAVTVFLGAAAEIVLGVEWRDLRATTG